MCQISSKKINSLLRYWRNFSLSPDVHAEMGHVSPTTPPLASDNQSWATGLSCGFICVIPHLAVVICRRVTYTLTVRQTDRHTRQHIPRQHGVARQKFYLLLFVTAASAAGPVTVMVCAANYDGHCCGAFADTIQVKFCPGSNGNKDYYVYQLKNLLCDMAYCTVQYNDASTGLKFC